MLVKQGTTGKTAGIFVRKSDGTAYTGLAYNASGFKCYYVREGGSAVAVTLSGTNWTETDATNMPGRYKFIIPDAALAASANYVEFVFHGAADMLPVPLRVELVAFDPFADFTTQVTAVKAKTDQLRFTMANMVDTTVYGIYTAQAQQIADAVWESFPGDYGGAGAALAEIQTNVNGIINTYDSSGYIRANMMDMDVNLRTALAAELWYVPTTGWTDGDYAGGWLKAIKATTDVFGRDGGGYISIGSVTGAVGSVSNGVDLLSSAIESVAMMVLDSDMSILSTPGSLAVAASAIKAKTDQLSFDPVNTTRLQTQVYGFDVVAYSGISSAVWNATAASYVAPGSMGSNFNAIKAKTDQLNFTGTDIKATLDGESVVLSAAALNAINVEVDAALNTVIPVAPTAGSINDKLNTLSFYEGKLRAYPEGGYVDSVSSYVPINPSVLASIWSYPTSSISAVGSIGLQLRTNLDTTVSSRAATGALMGLADNAITAAKIATGAITNTKFAAGAIDASAIAANAITSAKIAAGAIESGAFAQGAINNFVLADDIAIDSVTTVWGDIMGNVSGNVLGSVGSVVLPVEATFSGNVTLAQATIDSVAAKVWVTDGRALTSAVDVSSDDITEIRSGLATADGLTTLATYQQAVDLGSQIAALEIDVNTPPVVPTFYKYRMVTSSGDPVEGVTIRVTRDRESTDEVAPNQDTDSSGDTGWVLTPGVYYVTRTKADQTYSNPDIWRIQG